MDVPADVVFEAPLKNVYLPSKPILLSGEKLTLDWILTVQAPALAKVDWYLEFVSSNPYDTGAPWTREVSEEDSSGGLVAMPFVVRTFYANGAPLTLLPAGTHRMTTQFERSHNFARVQAKLTSGGKTNAKILSIFGSIPIPPPTSPQP